MNAEQLREVLAKHKVWRESGGREGARANLAGANLAGANLAGADLPRADLAGANLAGANLAGADLPRADLAGAYLAGANLAGAYLADAYLARANLARANLAGAYLAGADLAGAKNVGTTWHIEPATQYVRQVSSTPAERARRYRERHPDVPVVEHLDQKILEAISRPGCALNMGAWHTCETTHCRAGWAIHLAGAAGYELEKTLGNPAFAGRAIYRASTGRSPHFYATDAAAIEDIKRCAAEDAST